MSIFLVIFTLLDIPLSLLLLIPDALLLAGVYKAFMRWRGIVGAGKRPSRKEGVLYVLGLALLYAGVALSGVATAEGFGTPFYILCDLTALLALAAGIILTLKYRRAYGYWAAHNLPYYEYHKYSANLPPSVVENFRRIDPDQVFDTKDFVAVKKGDIYAFLAKKRPAVYFIKPKRLTPAPNAKKPNLPFLGFRAPHFKCQVNGIPLAKLKGNITIPVGVTKSREKKIEKYAEGPAAVYVLSRIEAPAQRTRLAPLSDLSGQFDKETIERVIHSLLKQPT
jgi:hypothetical protein